MSRTFTGTFPDPCEHGIPTVVHRNVVNQLHDDHGFADPCSTEQSNFTTLGIGGQEIDDFDAGDQDFLGFALWLVEWREGGGEDGMLVKYYYEG